jgi:hypothetical protein
MRSRLELLHRIHRRQLRDPNRKPVGAEIALVTLGSLWPVMPARDLDHAKAGRYAAALAVCTAVAYTAIYLLF